MELEALREIARKKQEVGEAPSPSIKEMFQCPECYRNHEEFDQADDCCKQEIESVYICSACDEEFDWEDAATEHLKEEHKFEEWDPRFPHMRPLDAIDEQYFEALFEGKSHLGLSMFRLQKETDFLIPPDQIL